MASPGPGGLSELSHIFRRLREDAGTSDARMTLHMAAAASGFSVSKVNRIERGRTVPSPDDAVALAKAYGAGLGTRARVRELAEVMAASKRRVVLSRPGRDEFQRRLKELEKASIRVREFSPIIPPGLLQTQAVIRVIAETGCQNEHQVRAFIKERTQRQEIVANPAGRDIAIITTEGALGWGAGPPEMMLEQLDRIATEARRTDIRVGVIPFGAGVPVFPASSWTVFDEHAVCPGWVNQQTILNQPLEVVPYLTQYEQLVPLVAWGLDALPVLARAAERYRSLSPTDPAEHSWRTGA